MITTLELFPMAPADAPNNVMASLTGGLKDAIEKLGQPALSPNGSASAAAAKEKEKEAERATKDKHEIARLSSVVDTLRDQLSE